MRFSSSFCLLLICGALPLLAETSIDVRRKASGPWEQRPVRLLGDLPAEARSLENRTLDSYGGDTGEQKKATGFFRVERAENGRWWLIDPLGHPFYNLGVGVVKSSAAGSAVSIEARNEKFGDLSGWAQAVTDELRKYGFNGLGGWSEHDRLRKATDPIPYTIAWNFMGSFGRKRGGVVQEAGHDGYPEGAIFVFDPGFESFCAEYANSLAAYREDPYLIGYFSDNELPFYRDTLDRFRRLPPDNYGRRAADSWCRKKGITEEPTDAEREEFREYVADRYFSIVCEAIRKADPNHLYLGSRMHGSALNSTGVWKAAGRYANIISVNIYGMWTPDSAAFRRWYNWSGRPFLVTEWYAKGMDSGLSNKSGAGWIVRTQADRGKFYQSFGLGLLETPSCVGWHWFRYLDNDPNMSHVDPSNLDSNKGIYTIRFEPYVPLLDAMKELNTRVYDLVAYFDHPAEIQANR